MNQTNNKHKELREKVRTIISSLEGSMADPYWGPDNSAWVKTIGSILNLITQSNLDLLDKLLDWMDEEQYEFNGKVKPSRGRNEVVLERFQDKLRKELNEHS